ncbi:MAG: amidohydrolase [Verrucomicrobiales bacterium]|nr:amidohydrolase [Verrucomicrobiales bacterium]
MPTDSPLSLPCLSSQERIDLALEHAASRIIAFRRHLHQHPELSLKEFATSAWIAQILEAEGIGLRLGSGDRGVIVDVGTLPASGGIALRADCDALPILEENTFPHASGHPGVMHACGHDAHTAMLLGAVIALHHAGAPVAARGIFQPAEEAGDGALGMISDGALNGVSAIIALHVDPNLPTGRAAAVAGPQTASCQDFSVTIHGRGGHAARPHLTIDPVAIAASLITQIYQAVPRHLDSRQAVVVSICQIHAGHASNVIPDTARLDGTIRSLDNGSAIAAREKLERLCRGVAVGSGAEIVPVFERRIPGTVNDPAVTGVCAEAAFELFGPDAVLTTGPASLGAEDFADYLQLVPGCMMRLGVKYPDRPVTPLHTPTFDLDETALIHGSRLLLHSLLKLAQPPC